MINMHEEDEKWLQEWIQGSRDQKFKEVVDDKHVDDYTEKERTVFKAGVNKGIETTIELYIDKFDEHTKNSIEEAEKKLEQMKEDIKEFDDEEVKEERQHVKELREIVNRVKRKRENFIKPIREGNLEKAVSDSEQED